MITRYEVQTWLRTMLRQTPASNSLAALARLFRPDVVCLSEGNGADLRKELPRGTRLLFGEEGMREAACAGNVDIVLAAAAGIFIGDSRIDLEHATAVGMPQPEQLVDPSRERRDLVRPLAKPGVVLDGARGRLGPDLLRQPRLQCREFGRRLDRVVARVRQVDLEVVGHAGRTWALVEAGADVLVPHMGLTSGGAIGAPSIGHTCASAAASSTSACEWVDLATRKRGAMARTSATDNDCPPR